MTKTGVTGATGHLGGMIVKGLAARLGAENVVALARSPDKAAALGVAVRHADYDKPETLVEALKGIDTLMFVASPDTGRRLPQHKAVVDAAKAAGVQRIVYTGWLHSDKSIVEPIAHEDRETEKMLKESGILLTILRNGYYTENHLQVLKGALAAGAFVGSAGSAGKFSCAPRADYAAAAVEVVCSPPDKYAGKTLELAGDPDKAYTLPEFAAEVAKQTGKPFPYQDLPQKEYAKVLASTGLPDSMAQCYSLFDVDAAKGALFHDGTELSDLIGRPTTPLAEVLPAWLPTSA